MSAAEEAALYQELSELRKEVGQLRSDALVAVAKERELRALISYLNKLGPRPENMTP